MGVLTELRQQAQSMLHKEDNHSQHQESLNEVRRSSIIEHLANVYQYLHDFLEQLHLVRPVIPVDYLIDDEPVSDKFIQSDYGLHVRCTYDDEVVGFIFNLVCENTINLSLKERDDKDEFIRELKNAGCSISRQTDDSLELEKKIPVRIFFKSDFTDNRIYIIIDNYNRPGTQHFSVKPDKLDDNFLNQLGNLILRRDNQLFDILDQTMVDAPSVVPFHDTEEDTEHTLTQDMNESRIRSLFSRGQQLYLTYREKITEASTRSNDILLGRSKKSNIIVNTDCASRHHAKILYRKGKFIVIDQSTNGTFVKPQGGKEIFIQNEEYPLAGSGFISLGKSVSVDNEHLIYFSCQ